MISKSNLDVLNLVTINVLNDSDKLAILIDAHRYKVRMFAEPTKVIFR